MIVISEVYKKKEKYMNKLQIVFKKQNFHAKTFDSDADSDS